MPPTGSKARQDSPRRAAFWKVAGATLSRLLGFGRESVIAAVFGASYVVDVTNLVESSLVGTLGFLTSPISILLVPALTEAEQEGEQSFRRLLSAVLGLFSLIALVMLAVVSAFPQLFVWIFAKGFHDEAHVYALAAFRWMGPITVATVISIIIKTALSVRKDFSLQSFSDAAINVVIISGLLLGARAQQFPIVKTAAYGVSALLLYLYFGARERHVLLPSFGHIDARIRHMLVQSVPLLVGSLTSVLNMLIDKTMASFLPEGSIACLSYATKIIALPQGVWAVQIAESAYPFIVSAMTEGLVEQAYQQARTALRRSLFFILPASAGLLLLATPITALVYQRGAFTPSDTVRVAHTIGGYTGLLLFSSVTYMQSYLFYARKDTMTPMIVGVVGMTVNVALNYLFGFVLGLGPFGLAVASSIAACVSCLGEYILYRRRYGRVGWRVLAPDVWRMLAATAGMAAVAWLMAHAHAGVMVTIAAAFVSYMVFATLLREDEAVNYCRLAMRLIQKKRHGGRGGGG